MKERPYTAKGYQVPKDVVTEEVYPQYLVTTQQSCCEALAMRTAQKQGLRSVAKVLQEKERESSRSFSITLYLTPVLASAANRIIFLNSVSNSSANRCG